MKFAVSIGTYELLSYAELNILQCRRVFGADVPILLSDGRSANSERMMDLAAKHDCFFQGEPVNREHFAGCMMNTISALVFAKQVGADIAIKCNQRLILVKPDLKRIYEMAFQNQDICVALPGRPDPSGILTSKFFSRFAFLNDVVAWRSGCIDPEQVKITYEFQCRSRRSNYEAFSETWQANIIRDRFPRQYAIINCLTNHTNKNDYWYLRKIQNKRQDYVDLAMVNGLSHFDFCIQEWKEIKGSNYKPFPIIKS